MPVRQRRPIDVSTQESYSSLKKGFVFIQKSQIKTWKAVFFIAFFAGIAFSGGLMLSLGLQSTSHASTFEVLGSTTTSTPVGKLMVRLGENTPPESRLVMGKENVRLADFTLIASNEADIKINAINIFDTTTDVNGLQNISLIAWDPKESSAPMSLGKVSSFETTNEDNLYKAVFANFNFILKKGQTRILTVYADTGAYPVATSGANHKISLKENSITYTNANDCDSNTNTDNERYTPKVAIDANLLTLYRTDLTVSLNASSPSGAQMPGSMDEVARFNFTTDEAYDVALNSVSFVVSGSALPSANGAVNTYTLKDKNGATLGTTTWTIGENSSTAMATWELSDHSIKIIPHGSTEILYVYVDSDAVNNTNDFQQGTIDYKNFQLELSSWKWQDGASESDVTPFSNEVPVESNELLY